MRTFPASSGDLVPCARQNCSLCRLGLLAFALLGGAGTGAAQNIVANSGFGGSDAWGWTVSSSYIYGGGYIGFDGYVLQDLQTTAGTDYLLRFDFWGSVRVSWGGVELVSYVADQQVNEKFIVHADTNLTRLQFFSFFDLPGIYYSGLDNVFVTPLSATQPRVALVAITNGMELLDGMDLVLSATGSVSISRSLARLEIFDINRNSIAVTTNRSSLTAIQTVGEGRVKPRKRG